MFNVLVPILRSAAQPVFAKATQTLGQKVLECAVKSAIPVAFYGVAKIVSDVYDDWRAKNGHVRYPHCKRAVAAA